MFVLESTFVEFGLLYTARSSLDLAFKQSGSWDTVDRSHGA